MLGEQSTIFPFPYKETIQPSMGLCLTLSAGNLCLNLPHDRYVRTSGPSRSHNPVLPALLRQPEPAQRS